VQDASETGWITERARAIGFDLCGVAAAGRFPELERLPEWLGRGYEGEMAYLKDPRREDPTRVLPGAKSVIACALNFNTQQPASTHVPTEAPTEEPRGWISRYAWGEDYHHVLGGKLAELVAAMQEHFARPFEARWYVDTGPVHERVFARHAGLGWLGKNTLLINEQLGSFLFLGVILTTLELAPSVDQAEAPPPDLCGSCRLCLDACPTNALAEPYVLDARRCISYLTIELRGTVPDGLREAMGRHVFGCDICQDVCPWNRSGAVTQASEFRPRHVSTEEEKEEETGMSVPAGDDETLFHPRLERLALLSEEEFRRNFRRSPLKRAKRQGLVRNVCIALGNSRMRAGAAAYGRVCEILEGLCGSPDSVVAESARWALARIEERKKIGG
jgi:epoxyqueuosine reductase